MTLPIGQSSGDFLESQRRIQPLYMGLRVSGQPYTTDALTQSNPCNVLVNVSTTLVDVTTKGVLGGSVAFIRPDAGNGPVGGPPAALNTKVRVLGLFIADARGVPFENTPGIASGEASYYADGGTYINTLWETHDLNTGVVLTYSAGDEVWASKNGLITNVADDNNPYEQGSRRTLVALLKLVPDASNPFMVFCLRL
jgi:hypothetical protein